MPNAKFAGNVECTVPFVPSMLIVLYSDDHLREALPGIYQFPVVVETQGPGIRAGPNRKHRKLVTKFVHAWLQDDVVHPPSPRQLSF